MLTRRRAIKTLLAGTAALSAQPRFIFGKNEQPAFPVMKGNIQHAVCRWCFSQLSVEDLCKAVIPMGITAIDLVGPADWPTLEKYGLYSSMCNGAEINLVNGWNDPQYHAQLIDNYSKMIPKVAAAGYKNLICFSGNRNGMSDEIGLANCVIGLKQVLPLAEKHGVVLCMELFNSKIDHKDYMCDHTAWGVALCKALGSEHFKLLYDIYHMQINEGDVIRNIRDYHAFIAHYHTAGVPGRHEIDDRQELYYPAIMRAIFETGYKGYVAQEFIPTDSDKLASLQKAV
ncbi:MAG: TIM barrel protein, partial [Bacteroidetes bacterium]|nr:TIM barrel protein [Bacteroidota bacterium]